MTTPRYGLAIAGIALLLAFCGGLIAAFYTMNLRWAAISVVAYLILAGNSKT
jgi:predicted benzoate:H+ symporter BenE